MLLLWARWFVLLFVPLLLIVTGMVLGAAELPGTDVVMPIGIGLAVVGLAAWFLRGEARVAGSLPALSLMLFFVSAIFLSLSAIAGVLAADNS